MAFECLDRVQNVNVRGLKLSSNADPRTINCPVHRYKRYRGGTDVALPDGLFTIPGQVRRWTETFYNREYIIYCIEQPVAVDMIWRGEAVILRLSADRKRYVRMDQADKLKAKRAFNQ